MRGETSRVLPFILFAYVMILGIETGGGLFTTAVVFPVWTASPEIVIGWKPDMPYFMQEGNFFMFTSSATSLLALALAIMSKRLPKVVRRWALGSALTFILVAVWTGVYFVPVQARMHGDAGATRPREELAAMLQHFVQLNWIRQALLVGGFVAALHALGLLYRAAQGSPPKCIGLPMTRSAARCFRTPRRVKLHSSSLNVLSNRVSDAAGTIFPGATHEILS